MFIRKLMDCIFTKREMSWLDDLMPEWKKKKLEDAAEEVKQRSTAQMSELHLLHVFTNAAATQLFYIFSFVSFSRMSTVLL